MTKNVDQSPLERDKFTRDDPSDPKSMPQLPEQTKLDYRSRKIWHRRVLYGAKLLLDACRIQAC
jgi:hypothetical protein